MSPIAITKKDYDKQVRLTRALQKKLETAVDELALEVQKGKRLRKRLKTVREDHAEEVASLKEQCGTEIELILNKSKVDPGSLAEAKSNLKLEKATSKKALRAEKSRAAKQLLAVRKEYEQKTANSLTELTTKHTNQVDELRKINLDLNLEVERLRGAKTQGIKIPGSFDHMAENANYKTKSLFPG